MDDTTEPSAAAPGPAPAPASSREHGDLIVRSATMAPASANAEARTVDVVISTGALVRRYDRMEGRDYDEELVISAAAVKLDRLNAGAALLDSHSRWSVTDVIGSIVPGSARVVGGELRATVKFSARPEVEGIWRDVQDGVLRSVSVGYSILKREIDETVTPPIYRATLWEPAEVSIVPIPADPGAGFRSAPTHPTTTRTGKPAMEPKAADTPPASGADPRAAPPLPAANGDVTAAVRAERERASAIRDVGAKLGTSEDLVRKLIDDGTALDQARALMIDAHADGADKVRTSPHVSGSRQDERETRAEAATVALLHRYDPTAFPLTDAAREYRGMTLLDMARDFVAADGIKVRGLSRDEVARHALARRSMTTTDFPAVLGNVTNRTLRASYEVAPNTFRPFCRRTTAPNFKLITRTQLGDAPPLLPVGENGEFKRGAIAEGKESYKIATYGRNVAITRQVLINDDLDAFSRVPAAFGNAIANLESDTVWQIFVRNVVMSDGKALFHAAHGNLAADGAAPSIASVSSGRAKMTQQRGLDGKTVLNVRPSFIIGPSALETELEQLVSPVLVPTETGKIVTASIRSLTPIAEPRLDVVSTNAWYLAANPGQIDTIEYAYLEGQEGAYIETREGFEVDGIEIKCRLDFGAAAIDWRGFYKNPGKAA